MFSPGAILPIAVDRGEPGQRPALDRFVGDPGDLGLGHAGIVLELQRGQPAGLVAAEAGEGHDGADVGAPRRQPRDLGAGVEILGLDAHDRADMRRQVPQPPVIGGNSAISRAPAIGVSWSTCSWLIATRITSGYCSAAS